MTSKTTLIEENESADWLYTFADLMTLLLVFFVLLFSLSSVEVERFELATRSLNDAFQGGSGANSLIEFPHEAPVKPEVPEEIEEILPATDLSDDDADKPMENEAENLNTALQSLNDEISEQLKLEILNQTVEIGSPKDGKLTIKVSGDLLFPSGSADFKPEMMSVLDSVVLTLKKNPDMKLRIQGHTDDVPIETARFPSNWDLSAIRATNVLRYLVRGGLEVERVSATGYGDSRPLAANDSVENRAKNRRLEFVLERRSEQ
ncbi:OmpA/MotB family protein [Neptuniibacter pectenicola]|jgi:chemotaxis protein MotB|uniref:OmpA/MotB family protein n=1 Tax=Neptuniibacter pectenicola TaxID=1806669 RepID=UPI0030EE59F7|tara:strand:- start:10866 stop:11651 length:786 start_codon:yes stop_codon:yes gene_type:complete